MTVTISRADAILSAARTLAAKLLLAIPIDRAALSEAMTEACGGSDAAGFWQQRDSFEALEAAVVRAVPELIRGCDAAASIRALEALSREAANLERSDEPPSSERFLTPDWFIDDLTARELEVLEQLTTQLSYPEIASMLYVSSNTVKSHVKAIFRKLVVSRRTDAVNRARDFGLLPD